MTKKKQTETFYISCEGLQEYMYFEHLQVLINKVSDTKVNFKLRDNSGGDPLVVAEGVKKNLRLVQFSKNENLFYTCAAFDYDFKDDKFKEAITYCKRNNFKDGYSNVNFDLWLILHKKKYNKIVYSQHGYVDDLKKMYSLSKKDDIKNANIISKILMQIDLDDVKKAIKYAKELEKNSISLGEFYDGMPNHFNQPYLRIYEFIENIFNKLNI